MSAALEPSSTIEVADLAAVAGRAGEQADVARERLGGGEIDGLGGADPQRRADLRAVSRVSASASFAGRAASTSTSSSAIRVAPRLLSRRSVVTRTSTCAPATTACGEPAATTSIARCPRAIAASGVVGRRTSRSSVTGAPAATGTASFCPASAGGERGPAGRRVARGELADPEVRQLERPPRG